MSPAYLTNRKTRGIFPTTKIASDLEVERAYQRNVVKLEKLEHDTRGAIKAKLSTEKAAMVKSLIESLPEMRAIPDNIAGKPEVHLTPGARVSEVFVDAANPGYGAISISSDMDTMRRERESSSDYVRNIRMKILGILQANKARVYNWNTKSWEQL